MRKEDIERKCECEKSVGGATWQNQEKKKIPKESRKRNNCQSNKKKIRYKNPRKRIVRKAEEKPSGQTKGRIQQ